MPDEVVVEVRGKLEENAGEEREGKEEKVLMQRWAVRKHCLGNLIVWNTSELNQCRWKTKAIDNHSQKNMFIFILQGLLDER